MSDAIDARALVLSAVAEQGGNEVTLTFTCRTARAAEALFRQAAKAIQTRRLAVTLPGGAVVSHHEEGGRA